MKKIVLVAFVAILSACSAFSAEPSVKGWRLDETRPNYFAKLAVVSGEFGPEVVSPPPPFMPLPVPAEKITILRNGDEDDAKKMPDKLRQGIKLVNGGDSEILIARGNWQTARDRAETALNDYRHNNVPEPAKIMRVMGKHDATSWYLSWGDDLREETSFRELITKIPVGQGHFKRHYQLVIWDKTGRAGSIEFLEELDDVMR